MIGGSRALLLGVAAAVASPSAGCGFAVKHPAVTAGIVAGTLGFTTCKLASDNYGACFAVAGGAGGFLGAVTAVALWLGGDGNSAAVEEEAQPLPEDSRPRRQRHRVPDPADPAAADPAPPPTAPAVSPAPPAPATPSAPPATSTPPTAAPAPSASPATPSAAPAPSTPPSG